MELKIIDKKSYAVSEWAGGKTTQLYIYPENSSYADRNFTFRLSSATVDADFSTFTALSGVDRIIMVLDGALRLCYENHGEKTLNQYEQDSFDGGWNTTSYGKATDFNLMMRGCKGEIEPFSLNNSQSVSFECKNNEFLAFYVDKGECFASFDSEPQRIAKEKSLILCRGVGSITLRSTLKSYTHLVAAKIAL